MFSVIVFWKQFHYSRKKKVNFFALVKKLYFLWPIPPTQPQWFPPILLSVFFFFSVKIFEVQNWPWKFSDLENFHGQCLFLSFFTIKILNCPWKFSKKVAVKVKSTRENGQKAYFSRVAKIFKEKKKNADTSYHLPTSPPISPSLSFQLLGFGD